MLAVEPMVMSVWILLNDILLLIINGHWYVMHTVLTSMISTSQSCIQIANMQVGMTSPACCSLDGYLYITGMRNSHMHQWYFWCCCWKLLIVYVSGGAVLEEGDSVDLVMRYDPRSLQWNNDMAPMRIARSGSAAVVLRRKIYVCGRYLRAMRVT
jgi:hypothetical protein